MNQPIGADSRAVFVGRAAGFIAEYRGMNGDGGGVLN